MQVYMKRLHCKYFIYLLWISLVFICALSSIILPLMVLTLAGKGREKMAAVETPDRKESVSKARTQVLFHLHESSKLKAISNKEQKYTNETMALFSSAITENEKKLFKKLLRTFILSTSSNVTYFLYGGSLLGSYRHHGMIPWDDDVDLIVRENDKFVLLTNLRSLHPYFKVDVRSEHLWKFYHFTSKPTRHNWGAWPFIDIFFFSENDTFIWDSYPEYSKYKYEKKYIFPLVTRPFMGSFVLAPKNTSAVLRKYYNTNFCVTNSWSHKHQNTSRAVKVPCDVLKDAFPFVKRLYDNGKIVEILEKGNNRTSINTSDSDIKTNS